MKERIQKIIASCGYCSRRKAEKLIEEGRVTVNGKVASIGESADYDKDVICVGGRRLQRPKKQYFVLNKPKGYETTLKSETGKPTVISLLKVNTRLIPVGRLDVDSRGLLLLTNDGEFSNRIMHPRYPVDKLYWVKVRGDVPSQKIEQLRRGIRLEEGFTYPCKVKVIRKSKGITILLMTLHEGKKRQIRRMVQVIGFNVLDLVRTRIGPITLRGLKEGTYRELGKEELKKIRSLVGLT